MSLISEKSNAADAEVQLIEGLAITQYGPLSGTPVLMSAGLGGHGAYWKPQLSELAKNYRVILYDHRGTGLSARKIPSPYAVANLADDMRLILDSQRIEAAHIVGHAAGGVAGLELARTCPDRVQSLTVVNGWSVAEPHFKRCFEIRTKILQFGGPAAYLRAQPLFLFPAEWISDHFDELDEQAKHLEASFQDEATLMARIGALVSFDIRDALHEITCPVLLLSSSDDLLVPVRSSKILAEGLPNAIHVQMNWGGHAVNITAQDDFNHHLVAFVNRNDAS